MGLVLTRLEFGYRIQGDKPAWRPVHVFDDGAKTYVLLPADVSTSEMPPLFLIGEKNKAELINYRVSGRYMVVDRLFAVAELRLGTRKLKTVRIERMPARSKRPCRRIRASAKTRNRPPPMPPPPPRPDRP